MYNELISQIVSIPKMIISGNAIQASLITSMLVQIFILLAVLLIIYKKLLKGTSSETFVKGIVTLFVVWISGEILDKFNLLILGAFLKLTTSVIAISLIVIFQPELRKLLSYLGKSDILKKIFSSDIKTAYEKRVNILHELTETVKYLSKNKTGGLIVLQSADSQAPLSDVGIKLDAVISSELLITMFFPNTPLHDGAVLIKGGRIVAAGVLLPLTEDPKLSWQYGTRHRAAIGATEVHRCTCIVVSEETGDISITSDGTLKKYESIVDFKNDLKHILKIDQRIEQKNENLAQKVFGFLNHKKKD